jgi:hypothetical protein
MASIHFERVGAMRPRAERVVPAHVAKAGSDCFATATLTIEQFTAKTPMTERSTFFMAATPSGGCLSYMYRPAQPQKGDKKLLVGANLEMEGGVAQKATDLQ